MPLIYEERLEVELLKPDGTRLVSGPAAVRMSDERLEVARERGGPLLVEFEAIAGLRCEADAVRLLLDSGHALRLHGASEPEALARTLSDARSRALVPALALPDRPVLAGSEADLEWPDGSGGAVGERCALALLATHLVAVPATQAPFAIPLAGLRSIAAAGDSVGLVSWDGRTEATLAAGAGGSAFVDDLHDAHARVSEELRVWIGADCLEMLAKGGGAGHAVSLRALGAGASTLEIAVAAELEAAPTGLSFVRALAVDHDVRVGVSVTGGDPFARLVWCLGPWRPGQSEGAGLIALVAAHGATATAVFAGPADEPALQRLCGHVDAAVCALGLDLAPLRMRESDLPHYAGGGWLWPVRHFRPLRVARRACRGLVPYTSSDDWSQGILTELADLRTGAGRAI